jgi:plasmid maintenance system antidote protein VapI
MCLKVSRLFGSSPEVWMRLQAAYDLNLGGHLKTGHAWTLQNRPTK